MTNDPYIPFRYATFDTMVVLEDVRLAVYEDEERRR